MKWFCLVLTCAVCGALLGGTATAQEDPFGPLEFTLKLEAETSDNRDSAPDGFEEDNTDFYISPRIEALYDWERSFLDFYYEPTYRYRTDASRFQNDTEFYHDLNLHLRHELTPRLTVELREHYNYTDDPLVEEAGQTLRRDSSFSINRVSGTAILDVAPRLRASVSGYNRIKQYEEEAFDILDEESSGASLSFMQLLSRTLIAVAEVKYDMYEYESDTLGEGILADTLSFDRGSAVTAAGVGFDSEFAENCQASVRVGATTVEFEDDAIDSESAPYGLARIRLASTPATRFNGSILHTQRDSDVFPFAAQKYTDLTAGVEIDTTERVTFEVSGTYRLSEYDVDQLPSAARAIFEEEALRQSLISEIATERTGDEEVVILRTGVAIRIQENTLLRLRYQMEDEDSDVSTSYTRNSGRITLVQSF